MAKDVMLIHWLFTHQQLICILSFTTASRQLNCECKSIQLTLMSTMYGDTFLPNFFNNDSRISNTSVLQS